MPIQDFVVLMPIQDFVIYGGTLSSAIEPFYNADIFFFRNKLIAKHTNTLITLSHQAHTHFYC